MAVSSEEFVQTVRSADILSAEELQALSETTATVPVNDPNGIAAQLVRAGKLTRFQVSEILAGKAGDLVLGEYVILDRIGAGGMGQVFKARHRRMKRIVALKVLSPEALRDVQAVKRFHREVHAAAKLLHPNIVTAFDAGECRGQNYLVMEYVAGRDLAAIVNDGGPMPAPQAVNYTIQAAHGLGFAHAKGIVHRDVKPANLLVDRDGTVKILDLGLARIDELRTSPGDTLAQLGEVMGTAHYMAPEQGVDMRNADPRSDVYSLGCTLFYLLTANNLYAGDSPVEIGMAHRYQPIPDLRARCPAVSPRLAAIFNQMVAKQPDDRYQTMTEVVSDLASIHSGLSGVTALPTSQTSSAVRSADALPRPSEANIDTGSINVDGGLSKKLKSEKTWSFFAKFTGAAFATIIAPILVAILMKHYDQSDVPAPASVGAVAPVPAGAAPVPADATPGEKALPMAADVTHVTTDAQVEGHGQDEPPRALTPFGLREAHGHQQEWAKHLGVPVHRDNSLGMDLVLIPPGEFEMGSAPDELETAWKMAEIGSSKSDEGATGHFENELPRHRVGITLPYLLGATEVTIKQFGQFVADRKYVTYAERINSSNADDESRNPGKVKLAWRSPGYASTDDSPVTNVTWTDAVHFCNWLSTQEKLEPCYTPTDKDTWKLVDSAQGYRLPTEAEWEFACRGGTPALFSFGDDAGLLGQYAWYGQNADHHPQPVGLRRPNPFQLYDMHGNVAEWCHDWMGDEYYAVSARANPLGPETGTVHVRRGGAWADLHGAYCRSACRLDNPSLRGDRCGFRVLRVAISAPGE
jgi:serine/threonine protein kinase/formylglycine-generating enzyme required for sulfatase activity